MEQKTQTYLELIFPAVLVAETHTREVDRRDPVRAARENPRCIALRFFDRVLCEVEVNGEAVVAKTGELNPSPVYYPDGELMDIERVRREMPGSILLVNMEYNGWERVMRTRAHTFVCPHEDAAVLPTGESEP